MPGDNDLAEIAAATHDEIAQALGISRQRVQQLERAGMRKVRAVLDLDGDSWGASVADAWRGLPGMAPGCRQVGALRFIRWGSLV